MTRFTQLERALKAKRWLYDFSDEVFRDGNGKRLDYRRVRKLVQGMTLDELASYQDAKNEGRPAKRH